MSVGFSPTDRHVWQTIEPVLTYLRFLDDDVAPTSG